MDIKDILTKGSQAGASDIFLVGGLPLTFKINGKQERIDPEHRLMPSDINELVQELYKLAGRETTEDLKEEDFSFALPGAGRYRVNVFKQRGSLSAVVRVIKFGVPTADEYNIPGNIMDLMNIKEGLVLVTGPAGSGKSVTLACIIDEINNRLDRTIITMEDP
ncbi:MAG: Flp pilus assembly complex ATPase component TadA, partial [Parasporobacterium sp.]|nr:Flp pilus assembly complex ATPase component TadA [Parasporobacterium sp.]